MILLRWCALLVLLGAAAWADTLMLETQPIRELGPYSAQFLDRAGTLDAASAVALWRDGGFSDVRGPHADPGYGAAPLWLAIEIEGSAMSGTYLLATNLPYIPALRVDLLRSTGAVETLLDRRPDTPHRRVPPPRGPPGYFDGPSVQSAPFQLAPGERATLLVRFTPYGFGVLPLSLETPGSNTQRRTTDRLVAVAFYAFAVTKALLLAVLVLALRAPGGRAFLAFMLSGLVLVAQIDGLFFALLWPMAPGWNLVASFPMLMATCTAGFAASARMLHSDAPPSRVRMLKGLSAVSLVPLALWPIVPAVWLIPAGFILMVLGVTAQGYAMVSWTPLGRRRKTLALVSAGVFLVSVALITQALLRGTPSLAANNLTLVKILYGFLTLPMVLAYAARVAALNRRYADTAGRERDLARDQARILSDLLDAERRQAEAQRLAEARKERLESASHDLRQPIGALRVMIKRLARGADADAARTITQAMGYLDDLAVDTLGDLPAAETPEDPAETVAAQVLTGAVVGMFRAEAEAHGRALRHVPSDAPVTVSAVPVLRILSNVLSNAIKHAGSGPVLIGCRRRGGLVAIEVVDSGCGMTPAELERATTRYGKGTASQGSGLGLAICAELAAEQGHRLDVSSTKGKGTRVSLVLGVPVQNAGHQTDAPAHKGAESRHSA